MSGKLLMFAKLSLKSFIFHVLTDIDSTSLKVIFISDPNSDIHESKYKDIIFEIITTSQFTRDLTAYTSSGTFLGLGKSKKEKNLDTMKLNILITRVF